MYQHRVLFWGILGALVLRGLMIGVGPADRGISLDNLCFGVFLIYTGFKMFSFDPEESDPTQNPVVRLPGSSCR